MDSSFRSKHLKKQSSIAKKTWTKWTKSQRVPETASRQRGEGTHPPAGSNPVDKIQMVSSSSPSPSGAGAFAMRDCEYRYGLTSNSVLGRPANVIKLRQTSKKEQGVKMMPGSFFRSCLKNGKGCAI